jgi:ATP-binding cassette subfamily B protein/subfamily B ATP-binding cassette protein MsbA
LRYAPPEVAGLTVIGLLTVLGVALNALKPWPMKFLVDNVLAGRPLPAEIALVVDAAGGTDVAGQAGLVVLATLLLLICPNLIGALLRYVQTGVAGRMHNSLSADILSKLQRLSLTFHGRSRVGDLVKRVTSDASCVRELVMSVLLPAVTALLSLVAMFAVMWQLSSTLSLLAIAVAAPLALLIRTLSGKLSERTYRQHQLEGEMSSLAEQTLGALPVVQAFGREHIEHERFRRLSRETLGAHLAALTPQLQFKLGTSGLTALGTAGLMALGGFKAMGGELTVGTVLVFLSYLGSLYSPLETLAYLSMGYANAAAGARRVLEILDSPEEVMEAADAVVLPRGAQRGLVRWEGVRFGYEPGRAVLDGVSLEVKPGETVALVGATGAGKSTLVSLVPRFFDPSEGRVLVNGVDVRRATLASLRAEIGLVLQEPFLLPLTVAENIAYGRPEAGRGEIEAAARAANAHAFIEKLPEGYDTVIGERGMTLSGGERQRLSIARALLKNAPILILDEPTSSLDASTERSVMEALERLMEGRTTLIIAHRLSTVRRADRIVVLDHGRIVESGSHEQLLAANGVYSGMFRIQVADEHPALTHEPFRQQLVGGTR